MIHLAPSPVEPDVPIGLARFAGEYPKRDEDTGLHLSIRSSRATNGTTRRAVFQPHLFNAA